MLRCMFFIGLHGLRLLDKWTYQWVNGGVSSDEEVVALIPRGEKYLKCEGMTREVSRERLYDLETMRARTTCMHFSDSRLLVSQLFLRLRRGRRERVGSMEEKVFAGFVLRANEFIQKNFLIVGRNRAVTVNLLDPLCFVVFLTDSIVIFIAFIAA